MPRHITLLNIQTSESNLIRSVVCRVSAATLEMLLTDVVVMQVIGTAFRYAYRHTKTARVFSGSSRLTAMTLALESTLSGRWSHPIS